MMESKSGGDVAEKLDGPVPAKVALSSDELIKISKDDLISKWKALQHYVDFIEKKSGVGDSAEEKLKLQQQEATRQESVLKMRLATKEQEVGELMTQIHEMKQTQTPSANQLQEMLLDPAVNLLFEKMKAELTETKEKLEQAQNDLNAWKFTPDSVTGKKLMGKCRMLIQENQELGKQLSQGRIAQLEAELALQKKYSDELKESQDDLNDFVIQLDEEVEGMQSTICVLQQQLKDSKTELDSLAAENSTLRQKLLELDPSAVPAEKKTTEAVKQADTPPVTSPAVKMETDMNTDIYTGINTSPISEQTNLLATNSFTLGSLVADLNKSSEKSYSDKSHSDKSKEDKSSERSTKDSKKTKSSRKSKPSKKEEKKETSVPKEEKTESLPSQKAPTSPRGALSPKSTAPPKLPMSPKSTAKLPTSPKSKISTKSQEDSEKPISKSKRRLSDLKQESVDVKREPSEPKTTSSQKRKTRDETSELKSSNKDETPETKRSTRDQTSESKVVKDETTETKHEPVSSPNQSTREPLQQSPTVSHDPTQAENEILENSARRAFSPADTAQQNGSVDVKLEPDVEMEDLSQNSNPLVERKLKRESSEDSEASATFDATHPSGATQSIGGPCSPQSPVMAAPSSDFVEPRSPELPVAVSRPVEPIVSRSPDVSDSVSRPDPVSRSSESPPLDPRLVELPNTRSSRNAKLPTLMTRSGARTSEKKSVASPNTTDVPALSSEQHNLIFGKSRQPSVVVVKENIPEADIDTPPGSNSPEYGAPLHHESYEEMVRVNAIVFAQSDPAALKTTANKHSAFSITNLLSREESRQRGDASADDDVSMASVGDTTSATSPSALAMVLNGDIDDSAI